MQGTYSPGSYDEGDLGPGQRGPMPPMGQPGAGGMMYPPGQQPPVGYGNPRQWQPSSSAAGPFSPDDVKIIKDLQREAILNKFLPTAALGCGALWILNKRNILKPTFFHYAITVGMTSYFSQLSIRDEMKKRIAESPSQSAFAQNIRQQLGYVQPAGMAPGYPDPSVSPVPVEPSYPAPSRVPAQAPYYSAFNRFHRQKQEASEFVEDDVKDLTEFATGQEFTPEDALTSDPGFRTGRVKEAEERPKPRVTYDDLRMRNRTMYGPPVAQPGVGYQPNPIPNRPYQPVDDPRNNVDNNYDDPSNRRFGGGFKY